MITRQTRIKIIFALLVLLCFTISYKFANVYSVESVDVSAIQNVVADNVNAINTILTEKKTIEKTIDVEIKIPTYNFNIDYESCLVEQAFCDNISAGCLIDLADNTIIWAKNIHNSFRIASMTKMMTALVIIEHIKNGAIKMDDKVSVNRKAAIIPGSTINLQAGEIFTVQKLLKAMLISSANDAAFQLAEYLCGTEEAFVEKMNMKARELGLIKTRFDNSSGLPPLESEEKVENYSTPLELTLIAKALLKHPEILKIVSTWKEDFAKGHKVMRNTNPLVSYFPGVKGMKSGWYTKAGHNSTLLVKRGSKTYILSILGASLSSHRDNFAVKLLSKVYKEIKHPLTKKEMARFVPITNVVKKDSDDVKSKNNKNILTKIYLDNFMHSIH